VIKDGVKIAKRDNSEKTTDTGKDGDHSSDDKTDDTKKKKIKHVFAVRKTLGLKHNRIN
jgi:hypothetical protein